MEVSALKYSGAIGLHGRSPLLRLQSDERLVTLVRRGNGAAFEVLVSRYTARLLSFCRHLLASREDAEDVLQEVLAASYNAMLADERAINDRPVVIDFIVGADAQVWPMVAAGTSNDEIQAARGIRPLFDDGVEGHA